MIYTVTHPAHFEQQYNRLMKNELIFRSQVGFRQKYSSTEPRLYKQINTQHAHLLIIWKISRERM